MIRIMMDGTVNRGYNHSINFWLASTLPVSSLLCNITHSLGIHLYILSNFMLHLCLSFLLGDLYLQSLRALPNTTILVLVGIFSLLLWLKSHRNKNTIIVTGGFMLGFVWAGLFANQALHWSLPHQQEGKVMVVRGLIDSLPVAGKFGTHFIFLTSDNARIKLTWANNPPLNVGDRYELPVRLKRLHSLRNPGGFDYEAWALQNKLRATGSVIKKASFKFLGHDPFHAPVDQIRQHLQNKILEHLPGSETAPWLLALMIGERSLAPPQHWDILRATGTNHLMAIAGLHIGLISTMVYMVVGFLWRRSGYLTRLYPASLAASVAVLIIAWLYSGLAGFSIPTQRACIMVTFILCASLMRRRLPAWHAWSAALLVVMLLNPLAVLSESFWLSFGTLALIAYGMQGRLAASGWWWKWGRVQWVIGLGLVPLSLLFFQQTSIVSFLANSVAIPWLGFLVLPLCFLSSILLLFAPSAGGGLLWLADKSLAGLWIMLEWFAHLDFAVWTQAIPSPVVFLITLLACLWLLVPAGMPGRWLGVIWLLPLMFYQSAHPQQNNFWVTVLDVGQGLSVVVQTQQHTLVYDTGLRFNDQFDMGESVVLPFLRASGVKRVDAMIISHGDNDHIGGAPAILRAMPVTSVLTSAVEKFKPGRAKLCLSGTNWQWDGVNFSIIYPFDQSQASGNDGSCVLRINNGRQSVLLTGDIEKFAEKQLLAEAADSLRADLLTAPHHGSKTSNQRAFIQAVKPHYVVYATGYRNRYHFPHQKVINDYTAADVIQFDTVDSGAIQFHFSKIAATITPIQYRPDYRHYWHDEV